jgi:hypothetical protein
MVAATASLIPPSLRVEALVVGDDGLTIRGLAQTPEVRCPLCGEPAERVHSRATLALADVPWAGVVVRLWVQIRKFFCDNPSCPRRIFSERLAGIAQVSARRTERQRAAILRIAIANGGTAGARLAAELGYRVSPDTLLRLLRAVPEADLPTPAAHGGTARLPRPTPHHRPRDRRGGRSRRRLPADVAPTGGTPVADVAEGGRGERVPFGRSPTWRGLRASSATTRPPCKQA